MISQQFPLNGTLIIMTWWSMDVSLIDNENIKLWILRKHRTMWLSQRTMWFSQYQGSNHEHVHYCDTATLFHELFLCACSAPSHYLNQYWNIVNWTFRNKLQWNFNRNLNIFIHEIAFENAVCKMASILSRPRSINVRDRLESPQSSA